MFYSVLVAVYNAEKYLDRCINSIVSQTEQDYELVLVDDGSKDNSLDICIKWEKRYPKKIRVIESENQGSFVARRTCFHEAKGQYIYILDADDYILDSDFLLEAKKIIKKTDCDMVFFNATSFTDKRPLFNYKFADLEIFENEKLQQIYNLVINTRMFNPLWNKIFKREMIDFDSDCIKYKAISNGTDVFQMLPILFNCKKIIYWDEVVYYYQVENNQESIIHKFNPKYYQSIRMIYDRLCSLIKQSDCYNLDVEERLGIRWLDSIANAAYKVRLADSKEKQIIFEYLKELSCDSLFRTYYFSEKIKSISISRRLILKLLIKEKYSLLILLFRIANSI